MAVLLVVWLARAPLLRRAALFLDVSEQPGRADFVLVLGADHNHRPAVAAALYKAGLARQILVPVCGPSQEAKAGLALPEHEIVRRVLSARGVPDAAIVILPGIVENTAGEAAALGRFLEDHPSSVVTIVTTDYHTRRARLLFRRANLRVASLHFVAAPPEDFDATNWWQSERGCAAYLTEFVKLAAYSLGR